MLISITDHPEVERPWGAGPALFPAASFSVDLPGRGAGAQQWWPWAR